MKTICTILVLLITIVLVLCLRFRTQPKSGRQEIITDHGGHCCKEVYENGKLIDREWID